MFNQDQVASFVRAIIATASGWALARGYDQSLVALAGGVAIALVAPIWGYVTHSQQAKIASVNAIPGVTVVGSPSKV